MAAATLLDLSVPLEDAEADGDSTLLRVPTATSPERLLSAEELACLQAARGAAAARPPAAAPPLPAPGAGLVGGDPDPAVAQALAEYDPGSAAWAGWV